MNTIERLRVPVDAASLVAFRVLFGLLMFVSTSRFLLSGWIERFYAEPSFFFKYWGFSWVSVPCIAWVYAIYIGLAIVSLAIAVGLFYRVSALAFFVGFTYVELFDVTNYLNHYYLVSLCGLLLVICPLHRVASVDSRWRPNLRSRTIPAWCLLLFRLQIGLVYVFAGLAKFQSDWLLHAQPLNLWLTARTDVAVIGPFLDEAWVAYVASWFGFLFDTTIVIWLLWKRTRPVAYVVLLGFHFMTGVFFNIGMFPYIMTIAATVFFAPSWPRRFLPSRWRSAEAESDPMSVSPNPRSASVAQRLGFAALGVFCLVQIAMPLRHVAYRGNVLWNEQGMRWAWKVMVREKHGAVTFYVRTKPSGGELQVSPRHYLNRRQEREMSGQPDLILQLAHHIRDDYRERGFEQVEVRAEALVSLNGRMARHMIDREIDLAEVEDGLAPDGWILPMPDEPPIQLRKR